MIGEPDAGNPHVRFDEGRQETCVRVARLSPTLQILLSPGFQDQLRLQGFLWHIKAHIVNVAGFVEAHQALVALYLVF
jgi:hypothetical protein